MNIYKRRSLSPPRPFDSHFPSKLSPKTENTKKFFIQDSHIKLPKINQQYLNRSSLQMPAYNQSNSPIKPTNKYYYKISRIQEENNSLRDFITNFHLKKDGNKVVSSFDELGNGATYAIVGKVQRYFSQLEEYIQHL